MSQQKQKFSLYPIGHAHTPYGPTFTPNQPLAREAQPGAFKLVLDEPYTAGLKDLERCSHIIVLAYLDRQDREPTMVVQPPWAKGRQVGLFASRSPRRPNPIALSVVKLLEVKDNELLISPIDLFDNTPILDIKPYFKTLDAKPDATDGWIEQLDGHRHLLEHLLAVPHDHNHDHHHHHENHDED